MKIGKRRRLSSIVGIGAMLLTMGGVALVTAPAASAHTPSRSLSCSSWSVAGNDYNAHGTNHVTIQIDGAQVIDTDFDSSFTYTNQTGQPLANTATHTLHAVITAWDDPTGSHGWTVTYDDSVSGCNVTIPKPTASVVYQLTPPTCDSDGILSVNKAGKHWYYENKPGDATHKGSSYGPGTYNIIAHARPGYVFSGGNNWTQVHFYNIVVLPKIVGGQDCTPQPKQKTQIRDQSQSSCSALTVTTEHQSRHSTGYKWDSDSNKWVVSGWSDWATTSTTTRDMSGAEILRQKCDVYVETSNQVSCGSATITLHNHSPWIYPVSYRVDGDTTIPTPDGVGPYGPVVDNRGSNPNDQSASKTFTFPEDSGVHTIAYTVHAGTEADLYLGLPVGEVTVLHVDSDCQPNLVTPITPEATAGTCDVHTGLDSSPSVKLPDNTDAIHYSADGLTVTATIQDGGNWAWGTLPDGWAKNGDGTASIVLTVDQPDCVKVVVGPTGPAGPTGPTGPATTVTNTVAPTPTVTKTEQIAPAAHTSKPSNKSLAYTGNDTGIQIGIALALLALGGLIVLATTRRRGEH